VSRAREGKLGLMGDPIIGHFFIYQFWMIITVADDTTDSGFKARLRR